MQVKAYRSLVCSLLLLAGASAIASPASAASATGTLIARALYDSNCDQRRDPLTDVGLPGIEVHAIGPYGQIVAKAVTLRYGSARLDIPSGLPVSLRYYTYPAYQRSYLSAQTFVVGGGEVSFVRSGWCVDSVSRRLASQRRLGR